MSRARRLAVEYPDGSRVVFRAPRGARTVDALERDGVPLAVLRPGRRWRWWTGGRAAARQFRSVKLARPAPLAAPCGDEPRVVFVVPARVWRELLGASERAQFTARAPVDFPEDGARAEAVLGPLARNGVAAGVVRELARACGVLFEEREADGA